MRLDKYLFENLKVSSRTEAQKAILTGCVLVNHSVCTKCAYDVQDIDTVELSNYENKYVSRGGYKLESILEESKINLNNLICLDIGASTGGFTDCLLQHGAKKVYALENGYGQLHKSLLENPCVVNMENQNARYLTKEMFEDTIDVITMDVSFISQTLIIPSIVSVLRNGGHLFTLIKPQFEVGREHLGKKGIVKTEKDRKIALDRVLKSYKLLGFELKILKQSPIIGGDGNVEYVAYFVYRKEN